MILIVDDDMAVRMALQLALRHAGFQILEASTEQAALEAVRRPEVRAAILDMNLTLSTTGRQGIEILRKFRILRPEMPVILISAWGTIPLAVEGLSHGAADFITKPWDNRELIAKLRRAIADAESQHQRQQHVEPLDSLEREAIVKAIRQADGNLSVAASLLGISRQSLYRRIEKHGL